MELETLCNIFPAEVWEMIFKRIHTSRDMYYVIVALPDLLEIHRFQVQKPMWLFPEALPLLSEYLEIQGLLKCRLICKQWDQTLHKCVSNHPCHQPYNEDPQNDLPINTAEINQNCPMFKLATSHPVLHFRTAHLMGDFMEMSRNSQFLRDPVFGNTICFDPMANRYNTRPEFQQSSLLILTEFGNYIKHLILSSRKEFETPQQFYSQIYNYLQMTPNLTSLSLQFKKQDDKKDLSLIVNIKPLPMLPFLQSLHIKTGKLSSRYSWNIVQTLISFAGSDLSNVRKLKLEFNGHDIDNCPSFPWNHYNCSFQKLTELELRSSHDILHDEKFKECNLQKLAIHVYIDFMTFDERVLADCMSGKYGENLRVVNMRNCAYNVTAAREMGSARIKKLHTLQIRNFRQHNQFLLKLPSLVKLEVVGPKGDISAVGQIYDIFEHKVNPIIWKLLPNLQELRVPKRQCEKWILTSFRRPRVITEKCYYRISLK